MRRLLSSAPVIRAKTLLTQTGQSIAFGGVAILAAASAPYVSSNTVLDETTEVEAIMVAPPVKATVVDPGPVIRQIEFVAPVKGHSINSRFGLRRLAGERHARAHKGVDIAAPMGTSVFSTAEGVVMRTGYDRSGYGNFVEVRHPNGLTSLYAHLSRIDVATGTSVDKNQRVGLVGSTGRSTGPHLHFEIRRNGTQVNPVRVVGASFAVPVKHA